MYVALAEMFLEVVIVPYTDKKYGDDNILPDGRSQKERSIHIHYHILLDLFGAMMIL